MSKLRTKFLSAVLSLVMAVSMFTPMAVDAAVMTSGDEYITTENGLSVKFTAQMNGTDGTAVLAAFDGLKESTAGDAEAVFDGNTSTGVILRQQLSGWGGVLQVGDYIQAEFEEPIDLARVAFTFGQATKSDYFASSTVAYTIDGSTWINVLEGQTPSNYAVTYTPEEAVQGVKAVRLINETANSNAFVRLAEITVTTAEEAEEPAEKIKVACVGDSLTAGYLSSGGVKSDTAYPAYLQELLGDAYEVGNFGKNSMTLLKNTTQSYWNTTEFTESKAFAPDIVVIMLGSNDCKYWDEEAYRADAVALMNEYEALETNPRVIFAISPQCYVTTGTGITQAGVEAVVDVQRALVEENGWETVDMFEKTEGKETLYHSDLLHFTDNGYFYVALCMYGAIDEELSQSAVKYMDVDDADTTASGEIFKIQYSESTTWSSGSYHPELYYNGTEHYSRTVGVDDSYTLKFVGTGVQIFASRNSAHADCDVYIDDVYVGELIGSTTLEKQHKQVLFEMFDLEDAEHELKVIRKEGNTGAMQLDMIRVYYGAQYSYIDVDDAVSTTAEEAFKIKYLPNGSWTGTNTHPDLFYDATEHYTGQSDSNFSYEMRFTGIGVAVFASLNSSHGNCDVYIDDVYAGELVANQSSTTSQHKRIVFETYGLEDGEHVLRVVKQAGANAMQLDKIRVFYQSLAVEDIFLDTQVMRLGPNETRQINVSSVPWVATPEIEWSSADDTVATVDENGLVTVVTEEAAETIITAKVKGTEIAAEVTVIIDPTVSVIAVSVGDEKLLDTQQDYEALLDAEPNRSWSGTAWRGDILNSKIILLSKNSAVHNVQVTASEFVNEEGDIFAGENFEIKWLKEIEVNNGRGLAGVVLPYPDIIHKGGSTDIEAEYVKFAWVGIHVPENTKPGIYTGTIAITADEIGTPIELDYSVEVIDLVQPELEGTEVQLWQHPFSVANYYLGLGEIPTSGICNETADEFYFTEQHFNLMRAETEEYASIGGHDWVANIVEEAWNHQSYYGDPSMVKWTKNADGGWEFDYTWYDAWVEFGIECGVLDVENGVGKIKCYSMVPWNNQITYYDEASASTIKQSYTPGNDDWTEIWTPFLEDFMAHSKEMGWFDITYISMDERSMDQLEPTVELIESITDENGEHFKISSCLNYSTPEYYEFTDHIHDISVGQKHTDAETTNAFAQHRRELGLTTTVYTCTGDYPSNYTISDPGDNYWCVWNTMAMGTDGFLRWAWNNYVYDMHGDASYRYWEPGDCWFIYPVERTEMDENYNAGFYSTPRYELFKQGLRDIAKAKYLMTQTEELNAEITELTYHMQRPSKTTVNGAAVAANETQRMLTHSESDRIHEAVTALAREYVAENVDVTRTPVTEIFVDVVEGAWYVDSVQYVYDEGIIIGDGDVFAPNDGTTRAMVAVILYRLAGSPEMTEADYAEYNKFTDLPTEKLWYSDAVAWALKEKVSTGDDANMLYNPTSSVTREQLALFLWRYAKYTGEDVTVTATEEELFGGTYVNNWAKEGFAWAVDRGIIKGAESIDGAGNTYYELLPQGGATRAQLARILHRYIGGAVE